MNIDFPKRIFNALDSGILILNTDLKVLYWNRWLELHTGKPSEDVLEKKLTDLFSELKVSSLRRKIKTALALNSPAFYNAQTAQPLFNIQRPHISNTVFQHMKQDITISPYDIELGLVCINIVDQTQLFEANYKLSTTADFKSDFLANMSHEIRTPMNAILGFVEQLSKTEKDASRQEQFSIIKRSGHSLLTIINDILDLSKIESGEFELNLKPCNIKQTFDEIDSLYKDLAKQNNITLQSTIEPNIPRYLTLDVMRTKQIIFNLLSNAIKFTPDNGIVSINASFDTITNQLKVSVEDTGIGIAKHNIAKIFKAFKQEESSTSEHFGGTGLGLSICSKLIKLMKGNINATSKEGEGSSFYFSIPAYINDNTPEAIEHTSEDKVLNLPDANVLIVEDNKTNQLLMTVILDELSLSYEIANDGLEAFEMFKNNSYDIILMDENMPKLSGREATLKIRELETENKSKKTPIIAVTANVLPEDRKRLQKAGMDDFISKPYTEQEIRDVLIKFLT